MQKVELTIIIGENAIIIVLYSIIKLLLKKFCKKKIEPIVNLSISLYFKKMK